MTDSKRFSIKFERGAYYVDIPNYAGGEVVDASVVAALVDALEMWTAYAEENLSEFDVPGDECKGDELCHACRSAGCIQMKIRSARAALASAA